MIPTKRKPIPVIARIMEMMKATERHQCTRLGQAYLNSPRVFNFKGILKRKFFWSLA